MMVDCRVKPLLRVFIIDNFIIGSLICIDPWELQPSISESAKTNECYSVSIFASSTISSVLALVRYGQYGEVK